MDEARVAFSEAGQKRDDVMRAEIAHSKAVRAAKLRRDNYEEVANGKKLKKALGKAMKNEQQIVFLNISVKMPMFGVKGVELVRRRKVS